VTPRNTKKKKKKETEKAYDEREKENTDVEGECDGGRWEMEDVARRRKMKKEDLLLQSPSEMYVK